jgi:hypothetical protein
VGKKKAQDERACSLSESLTGVFKFNCLAGISLGKARPRGSFVYLSPQFKKNPILKRRDRIRYEKSVYRIAQGFLHIRRGQAELFVDKK